MLFRFPGELFSFDVSLKVIVLIAQVVQNRMGFWILIGTLVFVVICVAYLYWCWVSLYQLWARALFSGAGVKMTDLIGINFRKSNAKLIVGCRIMSVQAETPVSMKELEQAYLSGADVEFATRAFIESEKTGQGRSFEELVDASRSEKLAEMLGYKN